MNTRPRNRPQRRWFRWPRRILAIALGLVLGYLAAGYAEAYLPGTAAHAARQLQAEPAHNATSRDAARDDEVNDSDSAQP